MTGYLRQKHGLNVGEVRVGKALDTIAPRVHQRRQTGTARATTGKGTPKTHGPQKPHGNIWSYNSRFKVFSENSTVITHCLKTFLTKKIQISNSNYFFKLFQIII